MSENLVLIKTLEDLDKLSAYIDKQDFVAYDCETTGLDKESEIIGFSVCADVELAYYVILARWDVPTQKLVYLETREGAKAFLQKLVGKNLIMHNAVFDCWKAETNFGVNLINSVHTDTMLLAHLVDENRQVGLKELGVSIFGEDSINEQIQMKDSVTENGGQLTRANYELYKADSNLIGYYGAKDTLLTLKLFYHLVPDLFEQELDKFFYDDETMPLLKGPTYQLNTAGLRIDSQKLEALKKTLEAECEEAKAYIYTEIASYVKNEYPGTNKKNGFNIGSSKQLSWLLFIKLGNEFQTLTKGGREMCKALCMPIPYSYGAKKQFIRFCMDNLGQMYEGKKKIGNPWNYIACDKESLKKYSKKYKWVEKFLEYSKNLKLLSTYVEGIQSRAKYSVIRPSFLQHGTTSGRYSSRSPNFQNLPRKDKRIKACIISRPDRVFVGADYSQLEPRVFASFSNDERLIKSFDTGEDFYSIIGAEVFDKYDCSLKKDDENSFAKKYPSLRDIAKAVALSATYGTTPFKMAPLIGKSTDEARDVIDAYFTKFPSVLNFMHSCHHAVRQIGSVSNLFGRLRRLPDATRIDPNADHGDLLYTDRNLLNLAVNHTIQSTAASIMNRAAVACYNTFLANAKDDPSWLEVKIVLQVHDELILEGPTHLGAQMSQVLKDCMEKTVELPRVTLIAEPKIGNNLADLK